MNITTLRPTMLKGVQAVLDLRTGYNANKSLINIVKPGFKVMDVGCGLV